MCSEASVGMAYEWRSTPIPRLQISDIESSPGRRRRQLSGHGTNEPHLFFPVWVSSRSKDVVEPDWRRFHDIGVLPRFPGKICLCLAGDESPVNCCHVMRFGDRQNGVEGAATDRA